MRDCLSMRRGARNKVVPGEEPAVFTIPMGATGLSGPFPSHARGVDFKSGQFDADLDEARGDCKIECPRQQEERCEDVRSAGRGRRGRMVQAGALEMMRRSSISLVRRLSARTPSTAEERAELRASPTAMQPRARSVLCRLALDLPILLTVFTLVILMELGFIQTHQSGFHCKDKSLDYKFIKDTVSMELLVISGFLFPFVVIWPAEAVLHRPAEYSLKSRRWWVSLQSTALLYRSYVYGLFLNLLLVEMMKLTSGNPRPTFFDICRPDTNANCTDGEYVASYTCTSQRYSRWFKLDASRSFPSGHTSVSLYCGLFIAWYLQRRMFSWHNRSLFTVPLLQTLCVAYAVVCSLTRVTDHRHHWWDVLAGSAVGVFVLLYTVLVLCKNFSCPAAASTSDISSSDSGGHNHHSVRRLLSSGGSEHTLPHAHIAHVP